MSTDTEELQLAPPQHGEPPMKQLAPFSTLEQSARKMIADAETVALLPPTEANAKVARTMRLEIKPLRVAVEKRHAELKRPILDAGNALDDGKNALLDLLKPMEAKLLAIEQHAEREALRIEDGKRAARHAELTPFLAAPISIDLGKMPDDEYTKMLADAKDLHQLRLDRAKKEKEAAEAQAKAEAEERERISAENAKLKKEAEEREAAAQREREEAARVAREEKAKADAELARVTAEADAKAKVEREKAEEAARVAAEKALAERRAIEAKAIAEAKELRDKARAEREEAERLAAIEHKKIEDAARKEQEKRAAEAKKERAAREKLEAEIAAKKAAEAKAEAYKEAAAKAAANAPTKEKLTVFAHEVRLLALKTFSVNNNELVKEVAEKTESFAKWIEKKAGEL